MERFFGFVGKRFSCVRTADVPSRRLPPELIVAASCFMATGCGPDFPLGITGDTADVDEGVLVAHSSTVM